jgi:hypothetical protein
MPASRDAPLRHIFSLALCVWPIVVLGKPMSCCSNSSQTQTSRFVKSCQQAGLSADCCRMGSAMLCTECSGKKTPRAVCASSCEAWQDACGDFWVDTSSSLQDGLVPCTDDSMICSKLLTIAATRNSQIPEPDTRICEVAGIPHVEDDINNCLGPRTVAARAKRYGVARQATTTRVTSGDWSTTGWGAEADRVLWL